MNDLTVVLDDRPGALADLGEATGGASINIEGMCATTSGGKGEIHILVDDPAATREALEGAGIEVSGDREVIVVDVEDRPGVLADLTRRIAKAGVDLDLVYVATRNRVVFGAADLGALRAALDGTA
jgi:hypothetical protein